MPDREPPPPTKQSPEIPPEEEDEGERLIRDVSASLRLAGLEFEVIRPGNPIRRKVN